MPRIKMLQSLRGSLDGLSSSMYYAGEEYDENTRPAMDDALATAFVDAGLAERVESKSQESPEKKVVNPASVPTESEQDDEGGDAEGDEGDDGDSEEELAQYAVGSGWYKLPWVERKLRKADALEALQNREE